MGPSKSRKREKFWGAVTQSHLLGYVDLIPPAEQIAAVQASIEARRAIDQMMLAANGCRTITHDELS